MTRKYFDETAGSQVDYDERAAHAMLNDLTHPRNYPPCHDVPSSGPWAHPPKARRRGISPVARFLLVYAAAGAAGAALAGFVAYLAGV